MTWGKLGYGEGRWRVKLKRLFSSCCAFVLKSLFFVRLSIFYLSFNESDQNFRYKITKTECQFGFKRLQNLFNFWCVFICFFFFLFLKVVYFLFYILFFFCFICFTSLSFKSNCVYVNLIMEMTRFNWIFGYLLWMIKIQYLHPEWCIFQQKWCIFEFVWSATDFFCTGSKFAYCFIKY